jgi:hypothetical protein
MASSSFGWGLTGITAYGGNPTVEIQPASGASTTGQFTIDNASATTRVNETLFVEATYFADIPNVNPQKFNGTSPQAIGTFSAEWSEVLSSPDALPRVRMNTSTGTTFTGYTPSASPNVRLSGVTGNSMTVLTPGPVTIRLRVTLHASDGSSRRKDFFTTLNIVGPAGA